MMKAAAIMPETASELRMKAKATPTAKKTAEATGFREQALDRAVDESGGKEGVGDGAAWS